MNVSHYTPEHLQSAAQRTADAYAEIANLQFGSNLPIPIPLNFDLCHEQPRATGRANHSMLIEINMILFQDNIDYILNNTIPHEIGHLVQYDIFELKGADIQGHGAEWKEIMRRFGKAPNKFHKLDVSKAVAFKKSLKKKPKKESKE